MAEDCKYVDTIVYCSVILCSLELAMLAITTG